MTFLLCIIQPSASCSSSEEHQQQDVGVLGHCPSITVPPSHSAGEYFKIYSHTRNYLSVPFTEISLVSCI